MSAGSLPAIRPSVAPELAPVKRKPSATRAASVSRARRVEEALKGNPRSLRHGAFARVAALPDIELEAALIYATRPNLDVVRDRRLVEQLATDRVMYARAVLACDAHGYLPPIVAAMRDHGNRAERLERAVRQAERERVAEFRSRPMIDLAQYRNVPGDDEPDEGADE